MNIKFEGKEIALIGDVFFGLSEERIGNTIHVLYNPIKQNAVDSEGNEYIVYWANENPESDDIEDMCNWENPVAVIKL